MYSVDGQESWNFFKNDFSNHIPKFGWGFFMTMKRHTVLDTLMKMITMMAPRLSLAMSLAIGIKFSTATKNIRQVGRGNEIYDDSTTMIVKPIVKDQAHNDKLTDHCSPWCRMLMVVTSKMIYMVITWAWQQWWFLNTISIFAIMIIIHVLCLNRQLSSLRSPGWNIWLGKIWRRWIRNRKSKLSLQAGYLLSLYHINNIIIYFFFVIFPYHSSNVRSLWNVCVDKF